MKCKNGGINSKTMMFLEGMERMILFVERLDERMEVVYDAAEVLFRLFVKNFYYAMLLFCGYCSYHHPAMQSQLTEYPVILTIAMIFASEWLVHKICMRIPMFAKLIK